MDTLFSLRHEAAESPQGFTHGRDAAGADSLHPSLHFVPNAVVLNGPSEAYVSNLFVLFHFFRIYGMISAEEAMAMPEIAEGHSRTIHPRIGGAL